MSAIEKTLSSWREETLGSVGGFDDVVDSLLLLIRSILLQVAGHGGASTQHEVCPRGVLLQGPPGSGKSHLASVLARVVGQDEGEGAIDLGPPAAGALGALEALRSKLLACRVRAEARSKDVEPFVEVIVLEGAEAFAKQLSQDDDGQDEASHAGNAAAVLDPKTVTIDLLHSEMQIWHASSLPIIALVPWSASVLAPAELCSPGAIEATIMLPVPLSWRQRRASLLVCAKLLPMGHEDTSSHVCDLFDRLASTTAGFLPCDLAAFCRAAALGAIRRMGKSGMVQVTWEDFAAARCRIDPTPMRGAAISSRPQATSIMCATGREDHRGFPAISGQHAAVAAIGAYVVKPFQRLVHQAVSDGTVGEMYEPPLGLLLSGGSGTGKSFLATQLAAELGAHLFTASPADLLASRVGDAEKKVASLFRSARHSAPSVVVLEDVDTIIPAPDSDESAEEGSTETCIAHALRAELDLLQQRRAEYRRLHCSGSKRTSPLASEALVLLVATTSNANRVAKWLRAPHRLSMCVELQASLHKDDVLTILRRSLADRASEGALAAGATRLVQAGARISDVSALCRAAGVLAVRRAVSCSEAGEPADLRITEDDFATALCTLRVGST
eukprot:TRINITY_DN94517_c0_g1_i1.p1 TRINITY_DN94517_c0_g1~~TRINITY_DN94517_c0_g1_i1.p1  ORF type:complete len:615 (+),score=111.49 TRINITY_DN94517_c0_g1_i1:79-1923(+)